MAGNTFGTVFRTTTFGESHGAALGVIIDGCPAGIPIEQEYIQKALNRRRPGNHGAQKNAAVTPRKENDEVEILSGVFEGIATGTPIALLIGNTSQHSADYDTLKHVFRPGHADYTYQCKYGIRDYRGGGRSSGRETCARVAAGAVAHAVLSHELPHFSVTAFTKEAVGIPCETIDFSAIEQNPLRAADSKAAEKMLARISALRDAGDSAGGIVECRVSGVPAGLGEPVFDKLDALIAQAMLSIGAVKGIEFGEGFSCARKTGTQWNDAMRIENSAESGGSVPSFKTNNAGGIIGGLSNGSEIVFRIAVKPVPSVSVRQETVTDSGENTEIAIGGRHDVCLCPRIVPVAEAMTCIVLADLLLRGKNARAARNRL
ncbi:MAG: chorismate synthase [Treponema brennaborense]|nr:chorismate synthase [Treponema brennaborense]